MVSLILYSYTAVTASTSPLGPFLPCSALLLFILRQLTLFDAKSALPVQSLQFKNLVKQKTTMYVLDLRVCFVVQRKEIRSGIRGEIRAVIRVHQHLRVSFSSDKAWLITMIDHSRITEFTCYGHSRGKQPNREPICLPIEAKIDPLPAAQLSASPSLRAAVCWSQ